MSPTSIAGRSINRNHVIIFDIGRGVIRVLSENGIKFRKWHHQRAIPNGLLRFNEQKGPCIPIFSPRRPWNGVPRRE